jgi:hypothetical protein
MDKHRARACIELRPGTATGFTVESMRPPSYSGISRKERRAIDKRTRREVKKNDRRELQRLRTANELLRRAQSEGTHDCVLHRDSEARGVTVQVNPLEQHGFHVARGEPTCPWCLVCEERKASGAPPTVFSEAQVKAWSEKWERKLGEARA